MKLRSALLCTTMLALAFASAQANNGPYVAGGAGVNTRIDVVGNTDTSGTPTYNQGFSERRAHTVAAEPVHDGVPRTAISMHAYGDTKLLVPTGPGVREPRNRRVEVVFH